MFVRRMRDDLVERRRTLLVGVDVCALIDQERAELPVSVLRGQDERARAVRQRVVYARTCLEQSARMASSCPSCTANSRALKDGPRARGGR